MARHELRHGGLADAAPNLRPETTLTAISRRLAASNFFRRPPIRPGNAAALLRSHRAAKPARHARHFVRGHADFEMDAAVV